MVRPKAQAQDEKPAKALDVEGGLVGSRLTVEGESSDGSFPRKGISGENLYLKYAHI